MKKRPICYKYKCWSTENTVIERAEELEEDHFEEDLDVRTEPHSHKKEYTGVANEGSAKDEISEDAKISAMRGERLKVYGNEYNDGELYAAEAYSDSFKPPEPKKEQASSSYSDWKEKGFESELKNAGTGKAIMAELKKRGILLYYTNER